jgi:AcrR family transcriptional regulator
VAEIKAAAWAEMQATGSIDLSLRSVARRLGMAPSALYRYFTGRDDLLTALIVDAFDDLTATLDRSYSRVRTGRGHDAPEDAFVRVAASYRGWALQDPLRYRLIFGTPVGGYVGTAETTAATLRSSQVLLDLMADLVAAEALDLDRLSHDLSPTAQRGFGRWGATLPTQLPTAALAVAIDCYAAMHGAIQLEVNGHLPGPLVGNDDVFLRMMRQVIRAALR